MSDSAVAELESPPERKTALVRQSCKIPASLVDTNEMRRWVRERALRLMAEEVMRTANLAVVMRLALRLGVAEVSTKNGKKQALGTYTYQELVKTLRFVPGSLIRTVDFKYVESEIKKAAKGGLLMGNNGFPKYRSPEIFAGEVRISKDDILCCEGLRRYRWSQETFDESVRLISGALERKMRTTKSDAERERTQKRLAQLELVSIGDLPERFDFRLHVSERDNGLRQIVEHIKSGVYRPGNVRIRWDGRKLKFLLYISYKFEKDMSHKLDPERVCGVDLGIAVPAVCAINKGWEREFLGKQEDVSAIRTKHKEIRRRRQLRHGLSPNGRVELGDKERNQIRDYYHLISRRVVEFAVKNRCGTLVLEDLSKIKERTSKGREDADGKKERRYEHEGKLLWSPHMVREMITYKAERSGIVVHAMDPRYTSIRCSWCGHIDNDNREKTSRKFHCQSCGRDAHSDYNAARNLALASEEEREDGYSITE